ncbi:hypothetical protein BDM02DRAFT_2132787 [Thelephora ganbajun]|uniref:Uncharacterized protein n=1 Tax=Thelephora ganbajun TaxID=370292 RepID=A0ACB6ZU08_THEGA|nr:hypothetical protein BDM02DRAFT_2132787 [Thelephora ganbajun]
MLFSKSGWDLREYLLTATLPEISGVGMDEDGPLIVPAGYKSHANHLSTRPSPHRLLTSMYVLDYEMLRLTIRDFINSHAPRHAPRAANADPVSKERVTISSSPHFITKLPSPFSDPRCIDDFASWTHYFPLRTAERVFHIMFPETRDHKVRLNYASDQDENLFRHMTFGLCDPHQTNSEDEDFASYPPSLIIAVQPPWILAPRDLESFVNSHKFPPFDPDKPNSPFCSRELLWAKLWDLCVKKTCQWFIVSNYQGWVLGAFSSGWTRAWITDIIGFNDVRPTVIETIIFWLASSLAMPGAFTVPEFPEPVPNFEFAPIVRPAPPGTKRTPSQVSGTLSWNSQELRELDYESPDDAELSDDTISNRKRPVPIDFNWTNYKSKVIDWRDDPRMKACKQEHIVAPSERSGDSFVSRIHHYTDGIEMGTWMLGNPNNAHADTYYH